MRSVFTTAYDLIQVLNTAETVLEVRVLLQNMGETGGVSACGILKDAERHYTKLAQAYKAQKNFAQAFFCMELAHELVEREREFYEGPTNFEICVSEFMKCDVMPLLNGVVSGEMNPTEILERAEIAVEMLESYGLKEELNNTLELINNGPDGTCYGSDFTK